MITYEQYKELAGMPNEKRTNEQRSAMEVYEIMTTAPRKVYAYTKRQGTDSFARQIITWMGDEIGHVMCVNSSAPTSRRRVGFWGERTYYAGVILKNGIIYSARLHGDGMHCSLTAYKDQAAARRRYGVRQFTVSQLLKWAVKQPRLSVYTYDELQKAGDMPLRDALTMFDKMVIWWLCNVLDIELTDASFADEWTPDYRRYIVAAIIEKFGSKI